MNKFKIVLILLIIIIAGIGAYFVFVKDSEPSTQDQVTDTINDVDVSEPEPEGVVSIRGYFFERTTTDWDNTPVVCDTLMVTEVTGGEKSLVDELIQRVKDKNTVNALDEESGNLILNLELDELSVIEKEKIVSSTLEKTVELEIVEKEGTEGEVPACYSFVNILKVY